MQERILDAAEKMVQERGLSAVSFQQLADAVGLSKPSVFHHYPNKEALASALVSRCQTKYGREYGEVIDAQTDAPDKLRKIAKIFEQGLIDDRLCLLNSLGQSVATLTPAVQDDLRLSVSQSIDRYARVFEQGIREGTLKFDGSAEDAAAGFLALVEGLQVLSRAKRDFKLFKRATDSYINSIVV
ncbi:MAG: TetR/AcrR family transcriptional regulator [Planctomycetota bacterium]